MCSAKKSSYSFVIIIFNFFICIFAADKSIESIDKAFRSTRDAAILNSVRPPGNNFNNRNNYQTKGYQQVEINYVVPSHVSSDIKNQHHNGYPNSNSRPSTFSNYAQPPAPVKHYQISPTSPSLGNFDNYMSYNGPTNIIGYSGNGPSSNGASSMADWHSSHGHHKHGWGWMKEKEKVNFSAVGLLGLLALMGMIQHVMTEMDSSTPKPNTQSSFVVSGNSMGGRPRPPRPATTTAKPKPRLRRSFDEISLPKVLIDRLSSAILPSYSAIAELFDEDDLSKIDCSRFHAWRIFKILTQDFQVPETLAFESVSLSLKVMSENQEISEESNFWNFWDTWKSKRVNKNFDC